MEHIRVLTLSVVQLQPEDTPTLHLRAAIDGQPDRELAVRTDMEPIPFAPDLQTWVKNALLAAVDEL